MITPENLREAIEASERQTRAELRREIAESAAQTRAELRQEIATSAAETRAELRQEMADMRVELRQEIVASAANTRRHFDVVAEWLRGDIHLVIEGLQAMVPRTEFDHFRTEVREEFVQVRSLLRASYSDLDRRVRHLEARED